LDYRERIQRRRNDLPQIAEAIRRGTEYQQCDFAFTKVLLIRDVLIYCNDHFKACGLGSGKQLFVLETSESRIPRGLTIVTRKEMTQAFINAFVN
jgi:hypothetical protein